MGQNQSIMDLVQREISKETVTPYFIEYFADSASFDLPDTGSEDRGTGLQCKAFRGNYRDDQ